MGHFVPYDHNCLHDNQHKHSITIIKFNLTTPNDSGLLHLPTEPYRICMGKNSFRVIIQSVVPHCDSYPDRRVYFNSSTVINIRRFLHSNFWILQERIFKGKLLQKKEQQVLQQWHFERIENFTADRALQEVQ